MVLIARAAATVWFGFRTEYPAAMRSAFANHAVRMSEIALGQARPAPEGHSGQGRPQAAIAETGA
jgi:hypothetical protein